MENLTKLAIVTGTSSGVGLALADTLLQEGWAVVGLARRKAVLSGPNYSHLEADLSNLGQLRDLANQELAPFLKKPALKRIGLVNNAALIGALTWMWDVDPERLGQMFNVNAVAPAYLMGWLAGNTSAKTKLRIVNVSSGAAHSPFPGLGDYSATKAALRLSGQTLAGEFEKEGRLSDQAAVLSYEPGLVDTAMQDQARSTNQVSFPAHDLFKNFADQGLLVSPKEVVGPMVDFLESDPEESFSECRFIPGE